jgi:hypothetical protein
MEERSKESKEEEMLERIKDRSRINTRTTLISIWSNGGLF